MPKRKRAEVLRCQSVAKIAILQALGSGKSKTSEISFPEVCLKQDVQAALTSLKEAGEIYQTGKKRSAQYFLCDGTEVPEGDLSNVGSAPKEYAKEDGPIGTPEEKISEFIESMPSGLIGSVQAKPPVAIAQDFAKTYNFGFEESWKQIRKACKDGVLEYESRFEDGFRIFAWRA